MYQMESLTNHAQEDNPCSGIYTASLEDYVPHSGNTNSTLYPEYPLHVNGYDMEYRFQTGSEPAYRGEAAAPETASEGIHTDETETGTEATPGSKCQAGIQATGKFGARIEDADTRLVPFHAENVYLGVAYPDCDLPWNEYGWKMLQSMHQSQYHPSDLFTPSPEDLETDADDAEIKESTDTEEENRVRFIKGVTERMHRTFSNTREHTGTVLTSSQRYAEELKDMLRIATAVPGETREERFREWGLETALGAVSTAGIVEGHPEISADTPDTRHERMRASRFGRVVCTLTTAGVMLSSMPANAQSEEVSVFEQEPLIQTAETANTDESTEQVESKQTTEMQRLSYMRSYATGARNDSIEQNQKEQQENQRETQEQESDLLFEFPVDISRAEIKEGSVAATEEGVWSETWCHGSSENCHHNYYAADIFAKPGSPVVATIDGEVLSVKEENGDVKANSIGSRVEIKGSDGLIHYYAHLGYGSLSVTEGETIEAGTKLGTVGNSDQAVDTPPHLHYDVSEGRERINCTGHACFHRGKFANVQPYLQRSYQQQPATP